MMTLTFVLKTRPAYYSYKVFTKLFNSHRNYSKMSAINVLSESQVFENVKDIIPKLSLDLYKGSNGRICVIGGSLEYTGAPYFAAISALKSGCDLVHVFCTSASAPVIKSYSPELIVHPLLDNENCVAQTEAWLPRFHTVVIGPGLGRDPKIMKTVSELIKVCRKLTKPLIIDADGLYLITQNPNIIKDYPLAILTPNAMEFSQLFATEIQPTLNISETIVKLSHFGSNVIIVRKGQIDSIFDCNYVVSCSTVGSARRCGGQGDLLSGALGTFLGWALQDTVQINGKSVDNNFKAMVAAYAACRLTRECNIRAFQKYRRSMTVSNMIEEIHNVFRELFEGR